MTRGTAGLVIVAMLLAACGTTGEAAVSTSGTAGARTSTNATTAPQPTAATTTSGSTTPEPAVSSSLPRIDDLSILEDRNVAVPGGLPVDVFYPAEPGPWPVAITIHGGGWVSGRKEDLSGLARAVARHGVVVFNAEYRPLERDGAFPGMFEEIACAAAFAQTRAADYGGGPTRTIVGFSAGAHIGALVALAPEEFSRNCVGEPSPVNGFVGISGPYDSDQIPFLALQFGGLRTEIPETWTAGNPYTYLGRNQDLTVLLLHGGRDPVVDPQFSSDFADALRAAGYAVEHQELAGIGHFSIVDVAENGRPTADAIAAHVWQLSPD